MSKPRLNGGSLSPKNVMRTNVAKRTAAARRKIVIDESDEDFIDDGDSGNDEEGAEHKEPKEEQQQSLKAVIEQTTKQAKKKVESDEDWEEEEEEIDADGDETPSDDSDVINRFFTIYEKNFQIEERRAKRGETKNQRECREFFNAATKEVLLMQPRINEKIAEFVIASRPFDLYNAMVELNIVTGIYTRKFR